MVNPYVTPLNGLFIWRDGGKVVSDVDESGNPLGQKIYDKNGNYVTPGADQFGRYITKTPVSAMEDNISKLGFNCGDWCFSDIPTELIGTWCYIIPVFVVDFLP